MDSDKVKKVLVVGAGVMGHSIAQVFAQTGIETNLVDLDDKILERAIKLIEFNLETLAEFGHVSKDGIPAIIKHVHASTDLASAAKEADFVLEAVAEVPDVKQSVFSQLEECCQPDTVLASNTSSLEIFDILKLRNPQNLVTAHWFTPPHIIPLVEIAPGPDTSADVVTFTAKLMQRIGKRPVVMKQFVQSFIVNRIQRGISDAVWEMVVNGWATPEEIDTAVKASLGVRLPVVGVVQTSDFTGLDVLLDIMKARGSISPIVEELVSQGHLGAKTSKGIYDYGDRTEMEILKKRDRLYLKTLEHLEKTNAFEPI